MEIKPTDGVLWEEESKRIVQEFKKAIDVYRMEYSKDLIALFNEFGYLLVCRLAGEGYFAPGWEEDGHGDEGIEWQRTGIDVGAAKKDFVKIDYLNFPAEKIPYAVKDLQQMLREEARHNNRLKKFHSLLENELHFRVSIRKASIMRQLLIVIEELAELNCQYWEEQVLKQIVLQLHSLCLNVKNDRGRYMLPEQTIGLLMRVLCAGREEQPESLLDPQCGSGNMLIAAKKCLDDMKAERAKRPDTETRETGLHGAEAKDTSLYGFESNEGLGIFALILGLLTDTPMEISGEDFLQSRSEIGRNVYQEWNENAGNSSGKMARRTYDMVLANPTFTNENIPGNMQSSEIVRGLSVKIKSRYNLALVQSLQVLRTHGRAALIVPDGFLFSSRRETVDVRQWMLKNYRLEAVVSLPSGIFRPNTAVNTSVLFIRDSFMETGWDGCTPYVLFCRLPDNGEKVEKIEKISERLLEIWKQRDEYFSQWKERLQSGMENSSNVWTPDNWEPENGFFLKHHQAKLVEKTEERQFAENGDWKRFFVEKQREVMRHLSPFQEEILHACVNSDVPLPVHVILKKVKSEGRGGFKKYSVQDAIISVKILEGLGVLESAGGEKMFFGGAEITDSYQRPITIQRYQAHGR